jgi:hypothetical protein
MKMNLPLAIMGIKLMALEVISLMRMGTAFLSNTSSMSIANSSAHFGVHIDYRDHPIW